MLDLEYVSSVIGVLLILESCLFHSTVDKAGFNSEHANNLETKDLETPQEKCTRELVFHEEILLGRGSIAFYISVNIVNSYPKKSTFVFATPKLIYAG